MATTVFKFDDGSGHCAAKCFPARQKFKKNKSENATGAWLVAHNAELRRHFKAVLCSKPRTFEEIRSQRKKAEKEGTTMALQQSRQDANVNNDDGNILDGYFLLSRSCVRDPTDLCSVDISGQSLTDTVQTDFELFSNLVCVNAADNILNLELFSSFSSLQELEMPVNGLRGFKLNSEMFTQLRKLDISFNNLSSADIASLGLLPQLRILDISSNNLTHLPADLCQTSVDTDRSDELLKFPALEELVANDNKLGNDSTFQALAGLPSLVRLSLQKNDIEKVPQLLAINGCFIVQDEQKVDGHSGSKRTRRSARRTPQHCPTATQPTAATDLPPDTAGSCAGSHTESRGGIVGMLATDGRQSTGASALTSVSITVPRADMYNHRDVVAGRAAATETVPLGSAQNPAENKLVAETPAMERTDTADNRVESSLFPAAPVTSAADVSRSTTDTMMDSSSAFAGGENSDLTSGEKTAQDASMGCDSGSELKTAQDYNTVASPVANSSLAHGNVADTGTVTIGETTTAALSTQAVDDGSSFAMMTAPLDVLPGFDMCNFEFGELNVSEPDAKPSRKSTANIGPLVAPFPQLQHLNLAFNKISREESLLALAAWPRLSELLIHDNPLATSRKDQPIVNHFLKQRLGIQVFSKKPETTTKPHIEIPVKMHRVDDTVPSMPRCNVDELLRAIEAAPTQPPALMAPRCKSASEIPLGTGSSMLKTPLPPIATSSDTWTEDLCDNSRPYTAEPHTLQQQQQQPQREPFFMTETGENETIVIDDLGSTSPSVKSESCSSVALSTDLPHIYDGYELLLDVDESTLDDTLPPPSDINGNVRALNYALSHPLVFRDNRKETQKQLKPYQPLTRKPDPLFVPGKNKSEKTNAILTNLKSRETYVEVPLKEALSQKRGSKERNEAKKLVSDLQQKYVATRATSVLTTRQMINRLKDRSELMRVGATVPGAQHS